MPDGPLLSPLAVALAGTDAVSDAELLRRYTADADAVAFELLVRRHADVVWAVCRSVHPTDHHAAEDAFQTTFAVLARKAGVVREGSAAGWLFRVARNAAVRSRRRSLHTLTEEHPAPQSDRVADAEVARVVAEEVDRLSDKFRQPVLLCFYQGQTHAQAAARLGWATGTVASRLARAKERLRERLTRRGVGLPAVGVGVLLGTAPVSAVRAACRPTTNLTDAVRSLTAEVHRSMTTNQLKRVLVAVLAGLVFLAGAGSLTVWAAHRDDPKAEVKGAKVDKKQLADELAKLQGTWDVVRLADGHRGDAPAADLKGMNWVIDGAKITGRDNPEAKAQVGSFSLDPTHEPKHIDLVMGGPKGDQTLPGVYEFDGDILRIAVAEPGFARPKSVAVGEKVGVIELKKPDAKGGAKAEAKAPDAKAIADELERFQGEWLIDETDRRNQQAGRIAGFRISGREATMVQNRKDATPETMLLGFDPSGPFKRVNLTVVTGPKEAQGMLVPGIYSLEGDKLTVCLGDYSLTDAKRPTEFRTGGPKGGVLIVLTKSKK